MADKDTREDVETRGEPLPLPDGPRSEGGPAPRVADPPEEAVPDPSLSPGDPLPVSDDQTAAAEPPPAAETVEHQTPTFYAHDPVESERAPYEAEPLDSEPEDAAPSQEPAPAELAPEQPQPHEPWHAAIVEALAQPEPMAEAVPSSPLADSDPVEHELRASEAQSDTSEAPTRPDLVTRLATYAEITPAPVEDTTPADLAPEATPAAAASIDALTPEPPPPAPAPQTIEEPKAFTSAVAELFNPPPTSEVTLETTGYERTIGRRLRDPAEQQAHSAAPAEIATAPPAWKDRARVWLRYAGYAAAGYLALVLFLILVYRFVPPPASMLMISRLLTGTWVERTWVPLESISPALVRAVIVSEDDRFCQHSGIDLLAIRQAIENSGSGTPRGASTISMQVVKNLFLWSSKSYVRKIIEMPLTLVIELVWPKWRIMEVYLNVAEWGPGVFGAEAAARHHFGKSAARLSEREAALLAAALPNPVARDAGDPNARTSSKARVVQSRVRAYGSVASCVVTAAAAPSPVADKPRTVRKTFTRPKEPRKTVDEWSPSLKLGD